MFSQSPHTYTVSAEQRAISDTIEKDLIARLPSPPLIENLRGVIHITVGLRKLMVMQDLSVHHALTNLTTDYGPLPSKTQDQTRKLALEFLTDIESVAPAISILMLDFTSRMLNRRLKLNKFIITNERLDSGRDTFVIKRESPKMLVQSGILAVNSISLKFLNGDFMAISKDDAIESLARGRIYHSGPNIE